MRTVGSVEATAANQIVGIESIVRRPSARDIMVATAVQRFVGHRVQDAIYATAWDGDITVTARSDGTLQVQGSH